MVALPAWHGIRRTTFGSEPEAARAPFFFWRSSSHRACTASVTVSCLCFRDFALRQGTRDKSKKNWFFFTFCVVFRCRERQQFQFFGFILRLIRGTKFDIGALSISTEPHPDLSTWSRSRFAIPGPSQSRWILLIKSETFLVKMIFFAGGSFSHSQYTQM